MRLFLCLFIIFISREIIPQWFWQNPLPQGSDLNPVYFVDSSTGWVVGDAGTIPIKVFDILGNEVAVLVDKEQAPGNYEVEFSVARISNPRLTSGVYFYQLRAHNVVIAKKMLLLK